MVMPSDRGQYTSGVSGSGKPGTDAEQKLLVKFIAFARER